MTTTIKCGNDTLIQKKVITSGNSEIRCEGRYFVKCNISISSENNYLFHYDNCYFDINQVPPAIYTCLSGMKLDEEAEFLIKSNEELFLFDYELPQEYLLRCKVLSVLDICDLAKLLEIVDEIKIQGNQCFKTSKLEQCYRYYSQCLQILYDIETAGLRLEDIMKIEEAKITIHLNSGFCKRKLKHFNTAIEHCKTVFDSIAKSDEALAKAHYRLGEVYEEINYLDLSKYHYNRAAVLKKDKTFYNAYDRICKKISELKI